MNKSKRHQIVFVIEYVYMPG